MEKSLENWKQLYHVAVEFKKLQPWEWMYDQDVFGVKNPENGEIGYCCILGMREEVYGMAIYLGTKGLQDYLKISSSDVPDDAVDEVVIMQRCLMFCFANRSTLTKEELAIIKELKLKFRGMNAWPQFRSYEPGYFPWYLTEAEVKFFTIALQQATEVALRAKESKVFLNDSRSLWNVLRPGKKRQYLVRVQQTDASWSDQYLEPAPLPPKPLSTECSTVDKAQLAKMREIANPVDAVWEFMSFLSPTPVNDHSAPKPYLPYVYLWVDQASGSILSMNIHSPIHSSAFVDDFLKLLETIKKLPKRICVSQPEIMESLKPIASALGISLKQVKVLKSAQEAKNSFLASMLGFMGAGELPTSMQDGAVPKSPNAFMEWLQTSEQKLQNSMPEIAEPHLPQKKGKAEKRCGLCGKRGKLTKTPCCDNWICDDEDQYVLFSFSDSSCYRNHDRYTLCSHHYHEGHSGDWQTCKKCKKDYAGMTEMYVWNGTNEYNFTKLKNPPAYKPTHCSQCDKIIKLGSEGFASTPDGKYLCSECAEKEFGLER